MDNTIVNAIRRALVELANHDDYTQLKRDIELLGRTQYGALTGDLAVLNPLVDFARCNTYDRLQPLWELADQKAREIRWEAAPIQRPTEDAAADRKRQDSAVLMKARRERWTKAAKLWFRLTGERLIGTDTDRRREFEKEIQATWMVWRDELLTPDLSRDERLEIIRAFWEDIDTQLDQALAGDETVGRQVLGLPQKER